MEQLKMIRDGSFPRFAPIIGVANVDAPDEAEATERNTPKRETRDVITYTAEDTTIGEVLRTAQALEEAGHEVRLRFTRVMDAEYMQQGHVRGNPVWGICIGIRD